MEYLGNKALLNAHKTAFLCSRQVGSRAVLRCYDWATDICKEEGVVVSGFQSKIERDVLHFLLRGNKPIITPVRDKDLLRKVPIAYSFQCARAVPRPYSRRNSMQPMPHRDS